MKIEIERIPEATISEFADKHGLTMEIMERDLQWRKRFCANFASVEVLIDGKFLSSQFGEGDTPEEAIADYARNISLKTLIKNAMGPDRQEIKAPRFTGERGLSYL